MQEDGHEGGYRLRNNGESSSGRKLKHKLNISRDRISQIIENAENSGFVVSSLRRWPPRSRTPRNDSPVVIDHDRRIASHITAAHNKCVYARCAVRRLAATAARYDGSVFPPKLGGIVKMDFCLVASQTTVYLRGQI